MKKEEFFKMSDSEAIEYINEHYYIEDVNDYCMSNVIYGKDTFDFNDDEDDDEDDDEEEDFQPFGYVIETYEDDDLKEILWDITENCEELDFDEDENDCI